MKLKDFRKQRGLSRQAVATALGVTTVTVWRWETGASVPGLKQIQRIRTWSLGAVQLDDFVPVEEPAK